MTTDELIKVLKCMATYDCGFEEQSDTAIQAADELARLAKENAELREAQRWTDLSHKRPNESNGNSVLCRFADDTIETFYVESIDDWNKDHKKRGDTVTHWMPLPEPPQKG